MKPHTLVSRLALAMLLVATVFFTNCKKEEIKGPQGDPGTPGGGGNSDISSSSVFTVTNGQWQTDTVEDCLKVSLSFSSLTKKVVEQGSVKVYRQDATAWAELPYTTGDLFTQFGFAEGVLYLKYINIEGGIPTAPADASYRMVILVPNTNP